LEGPHHLDAIPELGRKRLDAGEALFTGRDLLAHVKEHPSPI
jgi:hypothetical protein